VPTARPERRTQASRRAATRGALLDATIEVLVDRGYAGLTTTTVCERAGVTRGAQAHYFATKADLVVQALQHLSDKLVAELVATPLPAAGAAGGGARAQYAALLDRLWEIFSGPVSVAQLELLVAARTDADLHAHLLAFEAAMADVLADASRRVAPELVDRDDFRPLMQTAIATIRGLRVLRAVASETAVRRTWAAARTQLLAGLAGPSA